MFRPVEPLNLDTFC